MTSKCDLVATAHKRPLFAQRVHAYKNDPVYTVTPTDYALYFGRAVTHSVLSATETGKLRQSVKCTTTFIRRYSQFMHSSRNWLTSRNTCANPTTSGTSRGGGGALIMFPPWTDQEESDRVLVTWESEDNADESNLLCNEHSHVW